MLCLYFLNIPSQHFISTNQFSNCLQPYFFPFWWSGFLLFIFSLSAHCKAEMNYFCIWWKFTSTTLHYNDLSYCKLTIQLSEYAADCSMLYAEIKQVLKPVKLHKKFKCPLGIFSFFFSKSAIIKNRMQFEKARIKKHAKTFVWKEIMLLKN